MVDIRRVEPLSEPVDASVDVPGSKSIANRALVCAALADGTSELTNVPDGDDTMAMLACLRAIGLDAGLTGDRVSITGDAGHASEPAILHAALAGTTSRFVTALAALGSAPITIDGHPPLRARPFAPLHDALVQLGVRVTAADGWGTLPVVIEGPATSGTVRIPGDISSQYVTALMLIGPYLPGGLRLELTTTLVSRPYVEMTADVMRWFGHDDVAVHDDLVIVAPGRYRAADVFIEPDASSASYPLAIAAVTGGSVVVRGLGERAIQGDARFAELLGAMGCSVERGAESVKVTGPPNGSPLAGLDVDMADISDLVPTMAAVALFCSTPTRIRGVGFIRSKESDRLGDLASELSTLRGDVEETDDGLLIRPSSAMLRGARLATHHDHRLAMAFGVIGSVVPGVDVEDPSVVTKSWPGFWDMLDGMR